MAEDYFLQDDIVHQMVQDAVKELRRAVLSKAIEIVKNNSENWLKAEIQYPLQSQPQPQPQIEERVEIVAPLSNDDDNDDSESDDSESNSLGLRQRLRRSSRKRKRLNYKNVVVEQSSVSRSNELWRIKLRNTLKERGRVFSKPDLRDWLVSIGLDDNTYINKAYSLQYRVADKPGSKVKHLSNRSTRK
jgi:hypothetical protein